jgi:hypothetical protein
MQLQMAAEEVEQELLELMQAFLQVEQEEQVLRTVFQVQQYFMLEVEGVALTQIQMQAEEVVEEEMHPHL